jgi:hypothetical protein
MFQALSDKNKALISVLIIVPISILIAWFSSGWQLVLLIAAVQIAVVFMARHVWMNDKSNFILRGTTLGIVSGVVLLGNAWDGVLESAAYDAKYNTLVRDYLNFLDEDL